MQIYLLFAKIKNSHVAEFPSHWSLYLFDFHLGVPHLGESCFADSHLAEYYHHHLNAHFFHN